MEWHSIFTQTRYAMTTSSILASKEFKVAIQQLDLTQKDKLILRLLRRDPILTQQLYFEWVDTETKDQKLEKALETLKSAIAFRSFTNTQCKLITRTFREFSKEINLHAKIYKNKWAEVRLNTCLIHDMLTHHRYALQQMDHWEHFNLFLYIIQKCYRLLMQIDGIDSDYYLEIRNEMEHIGHLFKSIPGLHEMCIHTQFDPEWCIEGEWPNPLKPLYDAIKPAQRMFLTQKRRKALAFRNGTSLEKLTLNPMTPDY